MTRAIRSTTVLGWALALSALLSWACEGNEPTIDEKLAIEQAAAYLEDIVHQTGTAMAYTGADDGTVARAGKAAGATADGITAMGSGTAMSPAMARALLGPRMTRALGGMEMPTLMTAEEQFDEIARELRRIMLERVFVEANFESKAGGTAVYLLHPDPTCRPLPADTDPPGTVPPIDAGCQDDLTRVEVRVSVRNDGDGIRMTVLVGPDRLEMITFVIHSNELAAEVDLPKAKAANDHIQMRLDGTSPAGNFERLAGRLRVSLKKAGEGRVTAALAILQAIDVAEVGGAAFSTGAADPVIALTGDGVSRKADLRLGLAATELQTTWDPQGTGVTNRDLRISTGGLYGVLALDDNLKQVLLTDVGIAQTRVTVRGAPIIDLNLNPDTMRRFSGRLNVNPDDTLRLELTPRFDLSLAFDYNAVAADFSSPPAPEVAHETYGVSFSNGAAAAVLESVAATATFGGGVKIVAGTLILSAASVPAQAVTVNAGQCLSGQTAPAGSHALLGALAVGPCP